MPSRTASPRFALKPASTNIRRSASTNTPASAASRLSRHTRPTHSASVTKSSSARYIASLRGGLLLHADRQRDWLSVFLQVRRQLKTLIQLLIFKGAITKWILDIGQLLRTALQNSDPGQQHRHSRFAAA